LKVFEEGLPPVQIRCPCPCDEEIEVEFDDNGEVKRVELTKNFKLRKKGSSKKPVPEFAVLHRVVGIDWVLFEGPEPHGAIVEPTHWQTAERGLATREIAERHRLDFVRGSKRHGGNPDDWRVVEVVE